MSQTVYVGNLPWSVAQNELSEFMSQCGEVEQAIIPQYRGRSKGFGIVTYSNSEGANRAISELDGTVLHERTIVVRENQREPTTRVFVSNLAWEVSWQELKDHFRQVGEVIFADVLTNYNGSSKGCGIVEFESPKQAQEAIVMLNNSELKGRPISIREEQGQHQNNQHRNSNKRRNSLPKSQRSNFNQTRRKNSNNRNFYDYNDNRNFDNQHQIEHTESDLSHRVFVSNLPYRLQWQELKDYMRSAGFVTNATIFKQFDGRSKGVGTVEFRTAEDAQNAINTLNNTVLEGRTISVQLDRGQQKSKSNFNGMH